MTKDQTFGDRGPARKQFYGEVLQLAGKVSSIILILGTALNGLLLQIYTQTHPEPIPSTPPSTPSSTPLGTPPSTPLGTRPPTPLSTPPSSPKLSLTKSDVMGVEEVNYDLKEALKKLMMFLIPGFDVLKTYPPALIISFDEEYPLAKVEAGPWSRFYEFRRALRVIHSYPCFSVFLATTGKVNQFMPEPHKDSNRIQKGLLRLITPFCELGYDQLAVKAVSNTTTLDDVASLGFMASLSRPL